MATNSSRMCCHEFGFPNGGAASSPMDGASGRTKNFRLCAQVARGPVPTPVQTGPPSNFETSILSSVQFVPLVNRCDTSWSLAAVAWRAHHRFEAMMDWPWLAHPCRPDPPTTASLLLFEGLIEAAVQRRFTACMVWRDQSASWRRRCSRACGAASTSGQPCPPGRPGAVCSDRLARRPRPIAHAALDSSVTRLVRIRLYSICSVWALDTCCVHRRHLPCPHAYPHCANHESTVARRIADAARGSGRVVKKLECGEGCPDGKAAHPRGDLLTSNTLGCPDFCH